MPYPKGHRTPGTLTVMAMYLEGKQPRIIARLLGLRLDSVRGTLSRLREAGDLPRPRNALRLDYVDTSGARCRCGLRLPCNSCIPRSAAELAGSVREHWSDVRGDSARWSQG